MGDIVLKIPLLDATEVEAFARYVGGFLTRLAEAETAQPAALDAPSVMIRSEPVAFFAELRTLIFQQSDAALAFADGWRASCPPPLQAN